MTLGTASGGESYRIRPLHPRGRRTVSLPTALADATSDEAATERAVLAADGTVLAVNRAWRRFGDENGAGAMCGPGAHYLRVTRRAADSGDDTAAVVVAPLEAVLNGDASHARVGYPCHGPDEQRWFRLEAERLPGRRELLVTHQDITTVVLAAQQLEGRAGEVAPACAGSCSPRASEEPGVTAADPGLPHRRAVHVRSTVEDTSCARQVSTSISP